MVKERSTKTAGNPASHKQKKPVDFALWWDRVGIAVVLIILILLMSAIAPNFNSMNNLLNIARAISINAILAAGMTFVILTAGIDLSVGSTVAVCGIISVLLAMMGIPAPIAILAGVMAGAVCGLISGFLSAFLGLAPFIVTLGMMTFLRGLGYTMTAGQPIIASDLSFRALGSGYLLGVPIPVYFMIAVYIIGWLLLERSIYGRHVYAVGGNVQAARLAGINVRAIITSVYVIAGGCAGLAGIISAARVISAQPTAGTGYELDAIAAVVLGGTSLAGGKGRLLGTLIGSIILGVLSNGLILLNVPFFTQLLIKGLVIIVAVAIDGLKTQTNLFRKKSARNE